VSALPRLYLPDGEGVREAEARDPRKHASGHDLRCDAYCTYMYVAWETCLAALHARFRGGVSAFHSGVHAERALTTDHGGVLHVPNLAPAGLLAGGLICVQPLFLYLDK
jgi:hypothetical protein